ncbi:MAG: hypothetical protein OQK46_01135 [Gammaproteobacteria bacterium]|nr:hypothetical protein [Gammaproteobacteria bacterium]
MNAKLILLTAAIYILPLSAIHAEDAQHANKAGDKTMQGDMGNMQQQKKKMMQQMNEIKNTKNPDQRDRLIEEHMKSMQQGMKMMGGKDMKMGMMGGKEKQGMGMKMDMDMDMDMKKHMKMMENRMDMMQDMMGQMMQNSMEMNKTNKIRKHRLNK